MKAQEGLTLDVISLKKAALVLRAINHPLRQKMLRLIFKQGQLTVTEIFTKLRLEQSVASIHLGILRKAGFVSSIRNGTNIFYSLNYRNLQKLHKQTYKLLGVSKASAQLK